MLRISLVTIGTRKWAKSLSVDALVASYNERSSHFVPVDSRQFASEDALFESFAKSNSRVPTHVIFLDSRGKTLSSESFATHLGRLRDTSTQHILTVIGPANGWSEAACARADLLMSLGPMTLPHELARVVLAEQIYRALTILAGHPYHLGH